MWAIGPGAARELHAAFGGLQHGRVVVPGGFGGLVCGHARRGGERDQGGGKSERGFLLQGCLKDLPFATIENMLLFQHQNEGTPAFTRQCSGV